MTETERPGPERRSRPRWSDRVPAIAVVLLAGLALRLLIVYVLIPGQGFRDDLRMFEDWAGTLATHGPGAFYANALPPGQSPGYLYTPGYLYVLWLVGAIGHGLADLTGRTPADSIAAIIKLPAIGADLAIAGLLYVAARRWWSSRAGLTAAALYLFIPITWYDSAVWGQVDAVGTLLLLTTILLILGGWSEPAAGVAVLAAATKPQYAIGLFVVGAVIVGRHLLRPGSGPVPAPGRLAVAVDRRLGGWFTRRQGPERLLASGVVAGVVLVLALAPFDLGAFAPPRFVGLPVVDHVAGFLILIRSAAGHYPNLTVNAFNSWAFVGPAPLVNSFGSGDVLTRDSIAFIGPATAEMIGVALLGLAAILVGAVLLVRHDRTAILVGFTVIALALFVLPTRSHERYLFPAVASGALLAADAVRWRWWLVALGLAQAANVHAVLTLPQFGSQGLQGTPLSGELHTGAAVAIIAALQTLLFAWVAVEFVRQFGLSAAADGAAMIRRRNRRTRDRA